MPSSTNIIGHGYAKQQMSDILSYTFNNDKSSLHSILLYGVPGVGKTHLVSSMLKEVEATCFKFSMPSLSSKTIGGFEKYSVY